MSDKANIDYSIECNRLKNDMDKLRKSKILRIKKNSYLDVIKSLISSGYAVEVYSKEDDKGYVFIEFGTNKKTGGLIHD